WPNGSSTLVASGTDWLQAAMEANVPIPTGCLGGSCGACEISVNGETLRACLADVPEVWPAELTVEWVLDPTW
ncbi:MAG: 2Fe-2S iron-sulfur cluster-binding protein, partial [Vulcanococcus sp.]